ncbi:MAG TPA: hypothetical protein VKE94_19055 [Gemmataceae bacterium]|nr:hypothetical protein [Gemmataceae bacterium]
MRRPCVALVICLLLFGSHLAAQTKTETPKQPDKKKILAGPIPGYKHRNIEGFDVLLHAKVLEHENDPDFKRKPLDVLELELNTITRSLPPRTVNVLHGIVIWVEWDDTSDPEHGVAVAKYYGVWGNRAMWSLSNDKHPLKANNVEIISLKSLAKEHQPGVKLERCVILHELSHAVHLQLFGPENPHVKAAYRQAMERKLYDEAEDVYGKKRKPYARVNDREYFAELSCAYLNKLHYFPFNREDLKKHDPTGYEMMKATWGTPKQIDAAVKIEAEKAATKRLDKAKRLQTDKKTEEACTTLEKLLEFYPQSKAAAEAKPLLEKLKK